MTGASAQRDATPKEMPKQVGSEISIQAIPLNSSRLRPESRNKTFVGPRLATLLHPRPAVQEFKMISAKLRASMFLSVLMLLIPWGSCWAAPFGFECRMSKEQVFKLLGSESLIKVEGDNYYFSKAPKPNEAFEFYVLTISSERGLLKVTAVSKDIDTNVYGDDLLRQFAEINRPLSKTYGQAQEFDLLKAGSIWSEDKNWMMALLRGERQFARSWEFLVPTDHITAMLLQAKAITPERGYISLSYEFEGFEQYVEADKEKESGSQH